MLFVEPNTGLICAFNGFNLYLICQVTPLFVACRMGSYESAVDVVRLLLQYGANPNKLAEDPQGNWCAPLDWASYHGRVEMVEALLRSGARQDHGTETTPFKSVTRDPKIDKLLQEYASGEATRFRSSVGGIERSLQEKKPHIFTQIRSIFDGKSVRQVLEESSIVIQTALLALLSIFLPERRDDLQTMTTTPLAETKEGLKSFLEAVIKSGMATDAHREMVYVLGNTKVGKTSLTETYKYFFENPDKTPKSILAKPDQKTRIAEVYNDAVLPDMGRKKIKEEKKDGITLISFEPNSEEHHVNDKCFIKIVDFGGHQVICGFEEKNIQNFSFRSISAILNGSSVRMGSS